MSYSRDYYLANRDKFISWVKDWKRRNPERVKAQDKRYRDSHKIRNREKYFLRRYGISLKKRAELLKKQRGKCAICGTKDFSSRGPCCDHNGKSGHIRGILCTNCNLGIGNFQHSALRLQKAIKYLSSDVLFSGH